MNKEDNMSSVLSIQNLCVRVEEKEILKGLNLEIQPGEVHAIMGLNGSGKSTLANVLAGKDGYEKTEGSVSFLEKDLLELAPEARAAEGLFLAFQYPVELPGVLTTYFLRTAYNAIREYRGEKALAVREFQALVNEKAKLLELEPALLQRSVNEGFSGGEKKRNEVLQMAVLNPKLCILDETDSGLDIDALQVVANGVNTLMKEDPTRSFLIITHYQRLLNHIIPDVVHVMIDGRIVKSGDKSLALELEEKGYHWLKGDTGTPAGSN
jgi:Fe-S cluster assembly ATP-binding protein